MRLLSQIKTYCSFILEIVKDLDTEDIEDLLEIKWTLERICQKHGIDTKRPAFKEES